MTVYKTVHMSVHITVYKTVHMSVHMTLYKTVHISVHMTVHMTPVYKTLLSTSIHSCSTKSVQTNLGIKIL